MRKVLVFSILLIAITVLYLSISKKKLLITGFALDGDKITVTINGNAYSVKNYRDADSLHLKYLYEELDYRSLRHDDLIHIELNSGKLKLLDTIMTFNNNNIQPRVYFDNPYLINYTRKVSLENDSGLKRY